MAVASLKEVDGKVVINTGTWLKLPKKVPVLFGQLPPVYHPSFHLNYFRIAEEDGRLAVFYERIEKKPPSELTWSQRLLTLTKQKEAVEKTACFSVDRCVPLALAAEVRAR